MNNENRFKKAALNYPRAIVLMPGVDFNLDDMPESKQKIILESAFIANKAITDAIETSKNEDYMNTLENFFKVYRWAKSIK